uniref:Uncharacterized protein n=1 Tax=Calidris pygmaea TaxID=425635 RepID=A0A8C3PRX8_9CHAR
MGSLCSPPHAGPCSPVHPNAAPCSPTQPPTAPSQPHTALCSAAEGWAGPGIFGRQEELVLPEMGLREPQTPWGLQRQPRAPAAVSITGASPCHGERRSPALQRKADGEVTKEDGMRVFILQGRYLVDPITRLFSMFPSLQPQGQAAGHIGPLPLQSRWLCPINPARTMLAPACLGMGCALQMARVFLFSGQAKSFQ